VESASAYQMLYLISKIFYITNQLYVCPYLMEGDNLQPWILFFKSLMDRPLQAELEAPTEDMDEIETRDKNICWKTKGVAFQTTYRLFSKYGNPKHCDDKYKVFSEGFLKIYALPLLESHL
jgi:hypothetical protein